LTKCTTSEVKLGLLRQVLRNNEFLTDNAESLMQVSETDNILYTVNGVKAPSGAST